MSMDIFLPFFFTIALFLGFVLMLSLGYIFAGKKIKGSCGGLSVVGRDGETLSCDGCPNKGKNPDCKNEIAKKNV